MELFSQVADQSIFDWFLIQDPLLQRPRWVPILFTGVLGVTAWSFHDDYGLSWWGAIWRTLVLLVASSALGYGAALIVRDTGPTITNDSKTIEDASFWAAGLVAFLIAGWCLLVRFPGAKAAGEQRRQNNRSIRETELVDAGGAPTVPQFTAATVVIRKRNPLAMLLRRLVGVIAGLTFLWVAWYGVVIGWSIVSGASKLGWQDIIIVVLFVMVGGLLFLLFRITRWGLDL